MTTAVGPFLGINNRRPETDLSRSERGRKVGDYLRNAINVDLTATGKMLRRTGSTESEAGTDTHSLWSDGEKRGYYVDGSTLYRYPRTAIKTGLVPRLRVSYALGPQSEIYWSNGVVIERIDNDVSGPLAPARPNPAPSISASSGGTLPGGRYLVAAVREDADGRQSAPSDTVSVTVPDNGSIQVSGLSGRVAIYMSPQNGDLLYRAATTTASSYTFSGPPLLADALTTLGLRPIPAGHIVRVFKGRLLVASSSMLFISEPYLTALYNPLRGYIPLPARITMVRPCDGGVFIGLDPTSEHAATYFLAGADPTDAALQTALPYGVVEGTDFDRPKDRAVAWFSSRGMVVGAPDGSVQNIQEDDIAVGLAEYGAGFFRESNGVQQMIATLFESGPMRAAATAFNEDESSRQENML